MKPIIDAPRHQRTSIETLRNEGTNVAAGDLGALYIVKIGR